MFKSEHILDLIQKDQYEKYLNLIYKLIIPVAKKVKARYSPSYLEFDDIVQDSVILFYRLAKEGKIKSSENIKGYLYVLAKNITLNKIKSNKIMTTELNDSILNLEDSDFVDEEHLENRTNVLQNALLQLSDSCQNLIAAYYHKSMSMKEIAQEYGYQNIDVVKTKHYKCKQKLASIINENVIFKSTLNA